MVASGQGWSLFEIDGSERWQIQKCDDAGLFVDDVYAIAFVNAQADLGCPAASKALQLDEGLPNRMKVQPGCDVDVMKVAGLEPEHAARYEKPWLAVEADGRVHQFESEGDACFFQRLYRVCAGFDSLTGEAAFSVGRMA